MAENSSEIIAERWQDYLDLYLPTEQKVARSALAGIEPEHAAAMAGRQAGIAFDKNLAAGNRLLAGYGIRPASDTDLAATTELIRRAAIIGASNSARTAARNMSLTRLGQVAAIGEGIPASSAATMTATQGQFDALQRQNALGKQQAFNMLFAGSTNIAADYLSRPNQNQGATNAGWQAQSYGGISERQAPVSDYNSYPAQNRAIYFNDGSNGYSMLA